MYSADKEQITELATKSIGRAGRQPTSGSPPKAPKRSIVGFPDFFSAFREFRVFRAFRFLCFFLFGRLGLGFKELRNTP